MVKDGAQRASHNHHGHHGGHQAADASDPEALKVNAPGLGDFVEQQARDQIARKHKEHGDAKQATLRPRKIEVVEDHRDNGECAQAVERGDVAGLGARRRLLAGGRCAAGTGLGVGAAVLAAGRGARVRGPARLADPALALRAFVRGLRLGRAASATRARLRELFHKTSSNDENNQHIFIVAACSCECLLLA